MRRSSQSSESTQSVWNSCSPSRIAFSCSTTSANEVQSGNFAQSISERPSSVCTKIGFGAEAANVDLPTPSEPYIMMRGGCCAFPVVIVSSRLPIWFSFRYFSSLAQERPGVSHALPWVTVIPSLPLCSTLLWVMNLSRLSRVTPMARHPPP